MAKDELIGDRVSLQQSQRAVDALLSHAVKTQEKKAETQLLPGKEQNVWLVVTVKQMQPEKKLKPYKIPIAHPIVDPRVSSVCLITKDPQREYKDLLETHSVRFISRVVGIEKLKGKFEPFEARRMLLKENDLFLADERVVPLLPVLLGSKFFQAKKQPIPVCLTRKDLKGELERAISSTYFHQNQGTCTSVKIGTISQPSAKVLDNLKMALPAIVKRIKGEWSNIQSFHIKTSSSASLPIWSCELGAADGARWDGLVVEAESEEESEAEASEDESEVEAEEAVPAKVTDTKADASAPTPKTKTRKGEAEPMDVDGPAPPSKEHGKGKKRTAEDIDNNTPQKKAKADPAPSSATKAGPKKNIGDAPITNLPKAPAVASASVGDASAQGKKRRDSVSTVEAQAPTQPPSSAATTPNGGDAVPSKPRKRRHAKAAARAGDAALPESGVDSRTEAVAPATPSQPTPVPAENTDGATRKKRKKPRAAATATAAADTDAVAPPAGSAMQGEASSADVPPEPAAPATPPAARKKRRRASAVDFFEDGRDGPTEAPAAPSTSVPPNTPAAGLAASTPNAAAKKRGKAVEVTPLKNALEGVAGAPLDSSLVKASEGVAKKRKKRKSKASRPATSENADAALAPRPATEVATAAVDAVGAKAGEDSARPKKVKRKHLRAAAEAAAMAEAAAPPVVASPSTAPTRDELKKKRSAAKAEKKKEKVLGAAPAAKSAKDAVVGKKHF